MTILFERRTEQGKITSANPADVWTDWRGENETWLFLAPHDDDIVCGCGLTFTAAVAMGINVHAAVISNGRMGYCSPEERQTIKKVRYEETRNSFAAVGLPLEKLYQFDYDDGNLTQESGRRFAASPNAPNVIEGGTGLENTMTCLFRKVKPNRLFIPNRLDLHPDHKAVHYEAVISIFHAQGEIWPELGAPLPVIPTLHEYATYSDFVKFPTHRITVSEDLAEKRLNAIAMYKSQKQIGLLVNELRKHGTKEYLLEIAFETFTPAKYENTF
ncbi:MAG: PIG-L family deacetylase [Planctomycetaceae bacterium]|nr:PIG-L family deacetylase [Planctomycetaceae bacterium]